jgi:NAD(P)H-dependent FMN reductase
MNIVIISASMRAQSQSLKVAQYLAGLVEKQSDTPLVIDLQALQLPNFDDTPKDIEQVEWLKSRLAQAEAFVFISPEWNGMMSYGLINMLHYVDRELADKPVLLVGVSNTRGGYYPVAQMQQIGQKNKHFVILPEHLVLSNIEQFMNDLAQEPAEYVEKRAAYSLRVLKVYAEALGTVRASGVLDYGTYPNGM